MSNKLLVYCRALLALHDKNVHLKSIKGLNTSYLEMVSDTKYHKHRSDYM